MHNGFALGCAVFASIGGLTFGYDQGVTKPYNVQKVAERRAYLRAGVIANVLVMKDFTERWPIGPWEKGLMSMLHNSNSSVDLC